MEAHELLAALDSPGTFGDLCQTMEDVREFLRGCMDIDKAVLDNAARYPEDVLRGVVSSCIAQRVLLDSVREAIEDALARLRDGRCDDQAEEDRAVGAAVRYLDALPGCWGRHDDGTWWWARSDVTRGDDNMADARSPVELVAKVSASIGNTGQAVPGDVAEAECKAMEDALARLREGRCDEQADEYRTEEDREVGAAVRYLDASTVYFGRDNRGICLAFAAANRKQLYPTVQEWLDEQCSHNVTPLVRCLLKHFPDEFDRDENEGTLAVAVRLLEGFAARKLVIGDRLLEWLRMVAAIEFPEAWEATELLDDLMTALEADGTDLSHTADTGGNEAP